MPFDRILSTGTDSASSPSVLYADIMSPLFAQFHQTISNTARLGQTSYRIRYRPSPQASKRLAVNGYGIELSLKRTDYIVIDDRSAGLEGGEEQAPEMNAEGSMEKSSGNLLQDNEEVSDLKPLSSRDLLGLGFKTSSFVMSTDDPLETLIKLSEDFPKHSLALTKMNASEEFVQEHSANREIFLPAGYNVIWMNGMQVQGRQMDAFALLEKLRRERVIIDNLRGLGLSGTETVQIVSHEAIADAKVEGDSQRYDYRDTIEGGKVIIWLNDIEKDKRYNGWPTQSTAVSSKISLGMANSDTVLQLLQRTFPGQLPQIRRDIHNVILPLDLSDVKEVELIVESIQAFVKRKIPIRFGIVPTTNSPNAIDQAKIVYYLLESYGLGAVLAYLEIVSWSCFDH